MENTEDSLVTKYMDNCILQVSLHFPVKTILQETCKSCTRLACNNCTSCKTCKSCNKNGHFLARNEGYLANILLVILARNDASCNAARSCILNLAMLQDLPEC